MIFLKNRFNEIINSDNTLIHSKFDNIRNYFIVTSITNGFDILFRQADLFVVSIFFGTHYAGIFKMIKTFVGLITQITNPIYIV